MVTAVRQRVSTSYTSFIANISLNIPDTYDDWKERILIMYEEHQRNYVYNQMHRIESRNNRRPGNQK